MFDFNFESLVTPKVIKYLYGLTIFLLGFFAVVSVIGVILEYRGQEKPFLVLGLIGAIVATSAMIAFLSRLWCESVIVKFKVAESIDIIRQSLTEDDSSMSDEE